MVAVMVQLLWDDEFKGFTTTANRIDWDSLIERRQFALLVNGQSQQVHLSDLDMGDDHIGFEDLKDADVFGPEVMAWGFTKLAKDVKNSGHIPWPVWVVWVAGNADKSIFGDRTGRPGLQTLFREPTMN